MTHINSKLWEKRWHPLLNEWVVIATHRQSRPWDGTLVKNLKEEATHDSACALCPGNTRANGNINPNYSNVFIFENDFPGISVNAPTNLTKSNGIFINEPAKGIAKVLCYSPQHNLTMAELDVTQIENIINAWKEETYNLSKKEFVKNIIIFENKGRVCGVSNPHPHGQIFATDFIYKNIETEVKSSDTYYRENNVYLFQDIILSEIKDNSRIIYESEDIITFLPFFSKYPFESYITTKKTYPYITKINDNETIELAKAIKNLLVKYDNMWNMEFPYIMTIHQAPTDGGNYDFFHFYIALYPALRNRNLQKHLGGAEVGGGNFHSDICPEDSAKFLLALPTKHYKKN